MNINYNDSNCIVDYLQYYLHQNYSKVLSITGSYDEYTHKHLLKYLDTPNTSSPQDLIKELLNVVSNDYYGISPITNVRYHIDLSTVVFHLKKPDVIYPNSDFVFRLNALSNESFKDKFYSTALNMGWRVTEYPDSYINVSAIDYDLIKDRNSINIVIKKLSTTDSFPKYSARYMVNYFNDDYINNMDFSENYFHKSDKYRIAVISCSPGDTFILAHSYSFSIPLGVGFSTSSVSEITDTLYTSTNMTSLRIGRLFEMPRVVPGEPIILHVPNGYNSILIRLPMHKYSEYNKSSPLSYINTGMQLGDINNDGNIDEIDLMIYSCLRNNSYFDTNYYRYSELINCIRNTYQNKHSSNVEEDNIPGKYNYESISENDIDNIVSHIKYLSRGSDLSFRRYIIDNTVKYKIVLGDMQSSINYEVLSSNSDSGEGITVEQFEKYVTNDSQQSKLKQYLYDEKTPSGVIYKITSNIKDSHIELTEKSSVLCSILAVKTDPADNIKYCNQVISGCNNDVNGTLSLPILDFQDNQWMVHSKFISVILDMFISDYSDPDDIAYVHNLIASDNFNDAPYLGEKYEYTEELRKYIQKIQITAKCMFSLGYVDASVDNILYDNYINSTQI